MLETQPARPQLQLTSPGTGGQSERVRAVRARAVIAGALGQESPTSLLALTDLDAEIAEAVDGAAEARRALVVRGFSLASGPVDLSRIPITASTFALLVVSGSLRHRTAAAGASMTSFVTAGDVLMPFATDWAEAGGAELLATEPVLVAALDRRFTRAAAVWPQLMLIIQRRICEQHHRLAVQGAIGQLRQVDQRLLAIMRHLADREGTVTLDGIVIPHRLSHQALADLVGARRPTVSLALKRLRDRGDLTRTGGGQWLLAHAA